MGQVNLPKMSNRNWQKQAVRKRWKLTKSKENPTVTKEKSTRKTIRVKVGNFGPKEGIVSILTSSYKSRKCKKSNQGKSRQLWAKGGCSFYNDEHSYKNRKCRKSKQLWARGGRNFYFDLELMTGKHHT